MGSSASPPPPLLAHGHPLLQIAIQLLETVPAIKEFPARGCSGSRFFCVPGHARGRKTRRAFFYRATRGLHFIIYNKPPRGTGREAEIFNAECRFSVSSCFLKIHLRQINSNVFIIRHVHHNYLVFCHPQPLGLFPPVAVGHHSHMSHMSHVGTPLQRYRKSK
jgi:hypothetical protein